MSRRARHEVRHTYPCAISRVSYHRGCALSSQVLDILEDWLTGRRWGFQRIDGTVGAPLPRLVQTHSLTSVSVCPAGTVNQLPPRALIPSTCQTHMNLKYNRQILLTKRMCPLCHCSLPGTAEAHRCFQQPAGGLQRVPAVHACGRAGYQPRHR